MIITISIQKCSIFHLSDFPGGPVVKAHASTAGGAGSIPGRGTKILHAARPINK